MVLSVNFTVITHQWHKMTDKNIHSSTKYIFGIKRAETLESGTHSLIRKIEIDS